MKSCPLPVSQYTHINMAHGSGGTLSNKLISQLFLKSFSNPILAAHHDSAVIKMGKEKFAFTTDSYVINPIFFPGGDIGSLAVYGTVNDLAMAGAEPMFLSLALILEEGFSVELLAKVVALIKKAAQRCRVKIVTGDTKVVDKGKGDGIYINTAGIGRIGHRQKIEPSSIKESDVILLSGDIARHGISIMAVREGLEFQSTIKSDSAPVAQVVQSILKAGVNVHCLRDLTRGGLASALVEIATKAKRDIVIQEDNITIHRDVKAACEMLGFDPLHVANEGRFICFVPRKDVDKALNILKRHTSGREASIIGHVQKIRQGRVTMKTLLGTERIVDMLPGDQLPRIC